MGKLDGKVAIVTGSGRGLGRAFALAMAREGCSVVTNSVDAEKRTADRTADEIRKAGGKAVSLVARVGTKQTAEELVNTAIKEFGTLHILVNNAGYGRDALLQQMTEEQWDEVVDTHLKGTFMNSQAAVKYMIENKIRGRIVNITSGVGIHGNIGQSNYAAAKGGIIAMTKTHSKELVRYGICVNTVAPLARTEMFDNVRQPLRDFMFDMMAKRNVLQKVGEPEDVAPLIVFLASDDAHFITGQVICATGDVGELPWD
ncbi:MAG: beta-ketoacyl-ACP reductase [Chloroflexi bacterium]|nr:MAG: beta-ketoacyl-ACP reductase [Chloroflexota bacterium]